MQLSLGFCLVFIRRDNLIKRGSTHKHLPLPGFFSCPVAMAEGKHPIPFRTRKLSPPAPMVLLGGPSGRVGRCRAFLFGGKLLRPRVKSWSFSSLLIFLLLVGCGKKNPVKNESIPRIAKAYITRNDDKVSVIDLEQFREIKDIPVGRASQRVALTPDYNYAYVTCLEEDGGGAVYKVRVRDDTTLGSIKLGGSPNGIVISYDGKRAYVANTGSNSKSISIVNLGSDKVEKTMELGEPSPSIALTLDDAKLLVAQPSANLLLVIDAKDLSTISQVSLYQPGAVTVSCNGEYVYVTSAGSNSISKINLNSLTEIHSFQAGDHPDGVAENPVNDDLLICNWSGRLNEGNILILDSTFVVHDTISVAGLPTAMAFSEDGANLWVIFGVSGGVHSFLSIDPNDYLTKDSLFFECGWPMDMAIVPGE